MSVSETDYESSDGGEYVPSEEELTEDGDILISTSEYDAMENSRDDADSDIYLPPHDPPHEEYFDELVYGDNNDNEGPFPPFMVSVYDDFFENSDPFYMSDADEYGWREGISIDAVSGDSDGSDEYQATNYFTSSTNVGLSDGSDTLSSEPGFNDDGEEGRYLSTFSRFPRRC